MVRAFSVDWFTASTYQGNSYDLYQKTWYFSSTLPNIKKALMVAEEQMCFYGIKSEGYTEVQ